MATISYYLDTRSGSSGKFPLKLRISHKSKATFISMGISLREDQWNSESSIIVNHPSARAFNTALISRMDQMQKLLSSIAIFGNMDRYDVYDIKEILQNIDDPAAVEKGKKSNKPTFMEKFVTFSESRRAEKTRSSYRQTVRKLRLFDSDIDSRSFEDINKDFMARFDAFLSITCGTNAKNVHYRNMRSVFNDAIDDGITESYPFRKFKIKSAPTKKRSLTAEELRILRDFPCEPYIEKYRDIFMLMFYLCGINAVDLFNAKPEAIRKGRLEYVRSKTGKQYSIKVEPEAMVLIKKYQGKEYMLNICDGGKPYEYFLRRMTKSLKLMGKMERRGNGGKKYYQPLFPDISQYWCRHTWATIAAELDIPKETIAAGLGHDMGNTTTAIYINFNQKKVDDANRKIIDFINRK